MFIARKMGLLPEGVEFLYSVKFAAGEPAGVFCLKEGELVFSEKLLGRDTVLIKLRKEVQALLTTGMLGKTDVLRLCV